MVTDMKWEKYHGTKYPLFTMRIFFNTGWVSEWDEMNIIASYNSQLFADFLPDVCDQAAM